MQTFEKIKHGEIQYHINRMYTGDKEARKKLVYHYSDLVLKIIDKHFNDQNYSKEDLFQSGLEGLLKALNNYNGESANIFSAKMNVAIRNEIKKFINHENKYNMYKYNNVKKETGYNFAEQFETNDKLDLFFDIIKTIPPREKEIIFLYFFKNMTQKEIGKKYNITHTRVQQILKNGISHIKKRLNMKKNKPKTDKKQKWIYKTEKLQIYIQKNEIENKELSKNEINRILSTYMVLINFYIKKITMIVETTYNNYKYIKDDLIQAGILGLLNAILKYSNCEQQTFISKINEYINIEIEQCINNEIQYNNYKNNNIIEIIELSIPEYYERNEDIKIISDTISTLPKIEKEIIYLYFYKNLEIDEIAKIYDFDISYIQKILKCGMLHIKIALEKNNPKNKKLII